MRTSLPAVVALLLLGLMPCLGWAQADGGSVREGSDAALDELEGGARAASQEPEPDPIPPELLPQVDASLQVEEVELGQVVPMTITVKARPGARVHLRQLREIGDFELLASTRREEPSPESDVPAIIMDLELITFEAGSLEVPPIELMVVLRDGRTGSVATPTLSLRVTDPLANENDPQPRPDHRPRPVMTTDQRALWTLGTAGALLLAILMGMVIGRLRARRRPKPGPPPPPPRPPEDVALEKLEAAEQSDWLEKGEVKTFHIAVSEAVREYLGGRYGFDSLEMTTTELLEMIDTATLRGITRDEVASFLFETDLVKFAKWRPDDSWSKERLEEAYQIVRKSTSAERLRAPRPQKVEPEKGEGSTKSKPDNDNGNDEKGESDD